MRRWLLENIGWKLLSFGLAILLWYGLLAQNDVASSIAVPIVYKNLPRSLEISSELPDRVYLKVRGSTARMNLATWSSVAVVLDLTSVDKPGDRTYVLDGSTVNLPYGIELIRAVPSQVRLRFERSVTLDVPVQPQFENGPPTGYRIAEHSIAPERVRVVGPESRVSGVEYAVTDPIDLSSTFGSAEFRVAAGVDDELVRLDRQQMLRVRVRVEKIEGFHD